MSFTSETAKQAGKKSTRAGKKNKTTQETRERFKTLLDANFDKIQEDLEQLAPDQRIKALLDLAKFVLPTLRSTELKAGEGEDNFPTITIVREIKRGNE
ncbi:hypothetical protein [Zunongwangia profunda]|uniref:hypothetical protein n=1 Tax=Zunongwangia profunda TaxID=398743 RepID=UPI001D194059|nr:hypothetical protein [Zunongwangia profunda]MCC4230033.1 hypothetical protein [Zunongwangia profunda]